MKPAADHLWKNAHILLLSEVCAAEVQNDNRGCMIKLPNSENAIATIIIDSVLRWVYEAYTLKVGVMYNLHVFDQHLHDVGTREWRVCVMKIQWH